MDMNRYLLLILAVFLTSLQLSSQTLYFDRLDIKDGLSQNTVNAIIQDSRGFMWFGTKDGLNRYDGTHFKVFKHSMYDDSGLGNNHVRCLVEDSDCNIWAGTNAGLYMYDTEHDRFMEIAISDVGGVRFPAPYWHWPGTGPEGYGFRWRLTAFIVMIPPQGRLPAGIVRRTL